MCDKGAHSGTLHPERSASALKGQSEGRGRRHGPEPQEGGVTKDLEGNRLTRERGHLAKGGPQENGGPLKETPMAPRGLS